MSTEDTETGDSSKREIIRLLTEYGLDINVPNKVVWMADQGANVIAGLRPHRLYCQDHLYNTMMRHDPDHTQLA